MNTIANMIESMLDRPSMYGTTPGEIEVSILTAMQCWYMACCPEARKTNPTRVRDLWRAAVHRISTKPTSIARLADETRGDGRRGVVQGMREVWGILRPALEQLAETGE